jgi:predicted permease
MFHTLLADLRYGLRVLRKAPGFSAVVITTLTLGIGMTTSMFSVVNGLLLNPLPYPDAERLVVLWQGRRGMDVEEDWFSVAQYVDIRDGTTVFEDVTLAVGFGATLTTGDEGSAPIEVGYVRATSTYLRLLAGTPALGRVLDAGDDAGDAPTVAVLSHGLWERVYGADPDIIGRTVTLDGRETEVVGVLSRDVLLDNEVLPTLGAVDPLGVVLSLPLSEALLAERNREDYNIMGKLKPGVPLAQAQAELDRVAAQIQQLHETDPGSGFFIRAVSLLDEVVSGVRRALVLLLGAVGVLLLIACVNVANLLFSRAAQRQREIGIRAAVGAGASRIVRQLLTESALLAAVGGALGVVAATVGGAVLRRLGGSSLPRIDAIGVDGRVLAFALVATIATCLVFGLFPAFRTSRVHLADVMKQGGGGGARGGSLWAKVNLSNGLVVAEIGLSLVLLIGGGLLARSLVAMRDVDPGFEPEGRLTFRIQLRGPDFTGDRRQTFVRDLSANLAALPSVEHVGAVSFIPFGGNLAWSFVTVPGYVPPDGTNGEFIASFRRSTAGYFEAMGVPLLQGRTFNDSDEPGAHWAVIIDEKIAEQYYAGRDPIGQRINVFGNDSARVVGVVGSVKHTGLDDAARPTLYLANTQIPSSRVVMVVHTAGDPSALIGSATRAVHQLDPDIAVVDVFSMEQRIAGSLAQRRFSMFLLQTFSVVALVLAAIGIYGLVSYRVSQGARDLGMRMALGAQRTAILQLVLGHGMALAAVGVAIGVAGALGATRLMQAMLFNVSATDGVTYVLMAVGLAAIVFVACFVPAHRATRVDPLEVLRTE